MLQKFYLYLLRILKKNQIKKLGTPITITRESNSVNTIESEEDGIVACSNIINDLGANIEKKI